jgi:hypothetical protein
VIQRESSDEALRKGEPPLPVARARNDLLNSKSYPGALVTALFATVVVVVLSELNLDFGETVRLSTVALTIFWGWVFFVRWWRSANPTKTDLLLIRWGCVPFVVGFQMAIRIVWRLRGLS